MKRKEVLAEHAREIRRLLGDIGVPDRTMQEAIRRLVRRAVLSDPDDLFKTKGDADMVYAWLDALRRGEEL